MKVLKHLEKKILSLLVFYLSNRQFKKGRRSLWFSGAFKSMAEVFALSITTINGLYDAQPLLI